jgi:putative endonuclease
MATPKPPRRRRPSRFRRACQAAFLFLGLPEIWPVFPRKKKKPRKPPTEAALAGAWGEGIAASHLARKGYRILERNVRFGSDREIDLVARSPRKDGPQALVFVEVKTRATEDLGRPFAAVDADKRRTLVRAAALYVRKLPRRPALVRFDVVEVVGDRNDSAPPVVRHIENAFALPAGDRLPL